MSKTLISPPKNIHTIVRREVLDVMREILSDPDADLELTPGFVRRLHKSIGDKNKGRVTSLAKVFQQYGI